MKTSFSGKGALKNYKYKKVTVTFSNAEFKFIRVGEKQNNQYIPFINFMDFLYRHISNIFTRDADEKNPILWYSCC